MSFRLISFDERLTNIALAPIGMSRITVTQRAAIPMVGDFALVLEMPQRLGSDAQGRPRLQRHSGGLWGWSTKSDSFHPLVAPSTRAPRD